MRTLSGLTDNYKEYVEQEKKTFLDMSDSKKSSIKYAMELQKKTISKTVVFYSNRGYGLIGVPKMVLRQVMKNPAFRGYKFIVILRNDEMIKQMKDEGFKSSRIRYVRMGVSYDDTFYKWMARARYLVIDGVLPSLYTPREGQTYIQTSFLYSGLAQGYQREMRYSIHSLDYVKNFLSADYILSPSKLYTEEILKDSYCLENLYEGQILTCQSPVIERLADMTEEEALTATTKVYPKKEGKEILVVGSEQINGTDIAQILKEISETPAYADYQFYYKPPQVGYRAAREWMEENPAEHVSLLPNQSDVFFWMKRCDVIVSDYNAYLFYSVSMEKPVIIMDVARRNELQSDFMKENMSDFLIASDTEELKKMLLEVKPAEAKDVAPLFSYRQDSSVILDVLKGKEVTGETLQKDVKKVCLIAAMGHFNKDKLLAWEDQIAIFLKDQLKAGNDVTVLCDEPENEFYLNKIERVVPKGIRILYRLAERVMTKQEMIDTSYLIKNLTYCDDVREALSLSDEEVQKRDIRRTLGNVSFDEEYLAGPFGGKYVLLALAMDAKKKYFWEQRNFPSLMQLDRGEKTKFRMINRCRIGEQFDGVYVWDENEREQIEKNGLMEDSSRYYIMKDKFQYTNLMSQETMDDVSLQGKEYWVASSREYLDGQRDMVLLEKYGDKEHRCAIHLSYAQNDKFEDIMNAICEKHKENPDRIFYLFEDQATCRKEIDLLRANLEMMDYTVVCSRYFLWDLLKEFSTYYRVADTSDIYEKVCKEYGVAYQSLFD